MGSILPFIRRTGVVFDDSVTQIIGEAYDTACQELRDAERPPIAYEIIAKRIIDVARSGERDPVRLRKSGLAALGSNEGRIQAS